MIAGEDEHGLASRDRRRAASGDAGQLHAEILETAQAARGLGQQVLAGARGRHRGLIQRRDPIEPVENSHVKPPLVGAAGRPMSEGAKNPAEGFRPGFANAQGKLKPLALTPTREG